MGYVVTHGRIKPRYDPRPNAAEARHERRVEQEPCYGCGVSGVELHHTLLKFDEKRWRRDHRYQLPVCPQCHRGPQGIHGIGNEETWLETIGKVPEEAVAYLIQLWGQSELIERYEGRAA